MVKLTSSGESHGPYIVGILEGIPAGLKIDTEFINERTRLRRSGYGRGRRMDFEKDYPEFFSGLTRDFYTTGAPIGFRVRNVDFERNRTERFSSIPRPGHVDFSGSVKYNFNNFYLSAERASGRLTVIDVVAGSICEEFLREFGIKVLFFVKGIGGVEIPDDEFLKDSISLFERAKKSPLFVPFKDFEEKMIEEIDRAREDGDSLGGSGIVVLKGVPAGLGDYNSWERRVDGLIAQIVMSIPSVKGVEIGKGIISSRMRGSNFHDPFFIKDKRVIRGSNNAGGIEGGVTNGEDIFLKFYAKPIPTLLKGIESIDFKNFKKERANYVRSDTVVVPAISLIAAERISLLFAKLFIEKFFGDTIDDVRNSYLNYIKTRRRFWQR